MHDTMTNEERQAKTLVDLTIYKEGVVAEEALAEGRHDAMETARLRRKVRLGKGAMEDIVAIHEALVQWTFERYFKTSFHLKEDLMAAGKAGLFQAAQTYDPGAGRDFGSWAFGYVRSAMLQEEGVDNHAFTLSQRDQARYRKIRAIKGRLELEGDGTETITSADIAAAANLTVDEVEALLSLESLSLDADSGGVEGASLLDVVDATMAGQSEDHLVAFATPTSVEEELVENLLDTLDPEDAKLLTEVVMNEVSATEMAERLGVTKQAVSQKVKRLLKKLAGTQVTYVV